MSLEPDELEDDELDHPSDEEPAPDAEDSASDECVEFAQDEFPDGEMDESAATLAAEFRKSDLSFLDTPVSELDALAYKFLLNYFENGEPISPYALYLVTLVQPKLGWNGHRTEDSLIPELAQTFPPSSMKARKELADTRDAQEKSRSKLHDLREERGKHKQLSSLRTRMIVKARERIAGLDPVKNAKAIKGIEAKIEAYDTEILTAQAEIARLDLEITEVEPRYTELKRKLDKLEKDANERQYSLRTDLPLLEGTEKEAHEFRAQLKTDWEYIQTWLREKMEACANQRQSTLLTNLEILCRKLGISETDHVILQHILLSANVEFYKKTVNRLLGTDRDNNVTYGKLCNIAPSSFTDLKLGESDLVSKGLVIGDYFLELNKHVLQTLATPGLREDDILKTLAGVPVEQKEHGGFEWKNVARAQGPGAEEMFTQLAGRLKNKNAKPIGIFVYGDKGASKTQGSIKAAREAGYDNAVIAHEFDAKGVPLSYQQRIANIKIAMAIGKSIDGFLLIVDEIDKIGGEKGVLDSLALLRLFENPEAPVIAIANSDAFSEAFKDRFSFSVRFHVPIATRRLEMFFNMAAGKLPDLEENRTGYEELLNVHAVLPRAMEQAIDNAHATGRGIEAVRASFLAKAELMTGSRTGLATSEPVIESWRYRYFNGRIRGHDNLTIDGWFDHINALPESEKGILTLVGGAAPNAEREALIPELAKALNTDILWASGRDFNSLESIETALNKARDMRLLLAVDRADDLMRSYSDDVMELLTRHTYPVVFLCASNTSFDRSSKLFANASFVIDCLPPDQAQCAAMVRQFLGIEIPQAQIARMLGLTVDLLRTVGHKRGKLLQDPKDPSQVLALLQQEYAHHTANAEETPVFVEWLDKPAVQMSPAGMLGAAKKAPAAPARHLLGPVVPF